MRLKDARISPTILATAAGVTAAAAAYALAVRPKLLRWGSTPAEAAEKLPGDALIPRPKLRATHAITIQAPAARVWPWLLQMGQGRGGFYSYDWIENLFRLNIHSADRIVPELQHLRRGDVIPIAPRGYGPRVAAVNPERSLVLFGRQDRPPFACSWTFVLHPQADGGTRLIERIRMDYSPGILPALFYRLLLEPASFVMERGMLLGIRRRAEAAAPLPAERAIPA